MATTRGRSLVPGRREGGRADPASKSTPTQEHEHENAHRRHTSSKQAPPHPADPNKPRTQEATKKPKARHATQEKEKEKGRGEEAEGGEAHKPRPARRPGGRGEAPRGKGPRRRRAQGRARASRGRREEEGEDRREDGRRREEEGKEKGEEEEKGRTPGEGEGTQPMALRIISALPDCSMALYCCHAKRMALERSASSRPRAQERTNATVSSAGRPAASKTNGTSSPPAGG